MVLFTFRRVSPVRQPAERNDPNSEVVVVPRVMAGRISVAIKLDEMEEIE